MRRARFEALRADLLDRLRRACADMPRGELDRLSAQMTRIRLKYEAAVGMPVTTDASAI